MAHCLCLWIEQRCIPTTAHFSLLTPCTPLPLTARDRQEPPSASHHPAWDPRPAPCDGEEASLR